MHCFITGTDTGVGKTYFTASLLRSWIKLGHRVAGFKPISSGSREDAEALHQAGNSGLDLAEVNPCHFQNPLSPWIAARLENRLLHLPSLAATIRQSAFPLTHVAVEGVGGWLTPLTEQETVADLALEMALPVVIVTRASLGTLNHTLLTIESIRQTKLPILGLVINHHGSPPDLATQTNPAALSERTGLACLNLSSQGSLPSPLPNWLLWTAGSIQAVD